MRFAGVPFVWCEQKLSYSRRLRDDIDATMEVTKRYPELKRWFSAKPYTDMY